MGGADAITKLRIEIDKHDRNKKEEEKLKGASTYIPAERVRFNPKKSFSSDRVMIPVIFFMC